MAIKTIHVLKGAKVEWVRTIKPDSYKDKEFFTANVAVTDADIKALTAAGLKEQVYNPTTEEKQSRYRQNDTLGKYLQLKVKAKRDEAGKLTNNPKVFNRDKTEFTGLIGNGSTANVTVLITETTHEGKTQIAAKLGDIQLVNLIEVESKGGARGSQFEDLDMSSDSDVEAQINRLNG